MLAVLLTQPYASTGTPSSVHEYQFTACLSLQRARVEHFRFANSFRAIQPFRFAMSLGALSGGEKTVKLAPRRCRSSLGRTVTALRFAFFYLVGARQSGRHVTEPTLVRVPCPKYRHGSEGARDGLDILRPLHSLPHSAAQISRGALAHSDGRKLPRPSGNHRAQSSRRPRCSAYRPVSNMAARLRPARRQ